MKSNQRDILGDLFFGTGNTNDIPGLEGLESLIHSCTEPQKKNAAPIKKLPLHSKKKSRKKKTTQYLRRDVYEGLTQAKKILKRMLPEGAKSRASQSTLVNHAVNKLLQEIDEKGLESSILKSLLEKKDQ